MAGPCRALEGGGVLLLRCMTERAGGRGEGVVWEGGGLGGQCPGQEGPQDAETVLLLLLLGCLGGSQVTSPGGEKAGIREGAGVKSM